eukprot:IDg4146t1
MPCSNLGYRPVALMSFAEELDTTRFQVPVVDDNELIYAKHTFSPLQNIFKS